MAFILAGSCWGLLKHVERNGEKHLLYIQEFERRDQEMLTFLFIYLLPFVRSEHSTFAGDSLMAMYVLVIIVPALAHADAFHFNPVMRLFGFRFYAVKTSNGVSNLLIARRELQRPRREIKTVGLTRTVFLQVGESDA